MPSPFHDHAVDLVENMIMCILARTARRLRAGGNGGGKIATELERVYKGRSGSVELKAVHGGSGSRMRKTSVVGRKVEKRRKKEMMTRHPDSSFYHPAQPHLPSTVVEVAFSQGRRKLWRLAQSYVHHAHVKCVIALELPYRRRSDKTIGSAAAISIWRPRSIECRPIDLRSGDGHIMNKATLNLYPSDFLPNTCVLSADSASTTTAIEIPLAPLASLLSEAKSRMNTLELLQACTSADCSFDLETFHSATSSATSTPTKSNKFDRDGDEREWKCLSWWKS